MQSANEIYRPNAANMLSDGGGTSTVGQVRSMFVLEYPEFVVYAEQSPGFAERALFAFGNWGYRRCFHGSVVLLGGCDVRSAPGDDTLVLPTGLRSVDGFPLAESVVASLIGRDDRLLVVRNPWREARSEWIDNDDQAPEVHATRQSLFCTSPGTSAWNLHWLNDAQPCSPTCLFAFDRSNRSLMQELLQTLGAGADAGSYISSEFWARVCIDRNFASRILDGCKLWAFLDGREGSDVLIYRPQPDTECVRNAVVRFSEKLGFVTYDGGSIEDLRATGYIDEWPGPGALPGGWKLVGGPRGGFTHGQSGARDTGRRRGTL